MLRDDAWKLPLLLLVTAAHAWLGWTLAHYHPSGKRSATAPRPGAPASEVLLLLDFSSERSAAAAAPRKRARTMQASASRVAVAAGGESAAAEGNDFPAASGAPLDLRVRMPAKPAFAIRDPLEHRAALQFEATRFDRAWQSDGSLTEVVARKSMIAGALLGALGALRKPCTERQRRQSDRDCVPDQYHYPGPGE